MIRSVEFLPEARQEMADAFWWYENRRSGLGSAFLLAMEAALRAIRRVPEGLELIAMNTRKVVIRRFPYLLFYVVEGSRILVTGVFHARRNPRDRSDRVRELVLAQ
ncbi:MAG TPA: type II toxin-antitoxin system RelE/ParE family toxin [Planctomycetota bacterium]|nr:type II toxin-antitoxin system RelE/ParE family toxin [Planctomycetota bacterium]